MENLEEVKKKANELGNMFYQGSVFDYDKQGHLDEQVKAKNRAKLCVETVLSVLKNNSIYTIRTNEEILFWNNVIKEIDLL